MPKAVKWEYVEVQTTCADTRLHGKILEVRGAGKQEGVIKCGFIGVDRPIEIHIGHLKRVDKPSLE